MESTIYNSRMETSSVTTITHPPSIFYHYDMGFEGFVPGSAADIYLYDFTSNHWWYTSNTLFPYLYDFTLNNWLYYIPRYQQSRPLHSGPALLLESGYGEDLHDVIGPGCPVALPFVRSKNWRAS